MNILLNGSHSRTKKVPSSWFQKSQLCFFFLATFIVATDAFAFDDWVYNLNSPTTDADGTFLVTWEGYGGDLFLDCLMLEVSIRKDGALFDYFTISNCNQTSFPKFK